MVLSGFANLASIVSTQICLCCEMTFFMIYFKFSKNLDVVGMPDDK